MDESISGRGHSTRALSAAGLLDDAERQGNHRFTLRTSTLGEVEIIDEDYAIKIEVPSMGYSSIVINDTELAAEVLRSIA